MLCVYVFNKIIFYTQKRQNNIAEKNNNYKLNSYVYVGHVLNNKIE